jgi:predicted Zn-dependent protease
MTDALLEARFNEAIRKRDTGDLDGSRETLEALSLEFPGRSAIWGTLGAIYFEQDRLEEAIGAFQKATVLSPQSELASISLFHALFDSGRRQDAFAEMRRFLALVPDSEEYRLLRSEMADATRKRQPSQQ